MEKPTVSTLPRALFLMLCGVCMGAADLVPGISGGTVAFVIGIYEDFIHAIRSFDSKAFSFLLRGNIKGFLSHVAWQYLVCVLLGIAFSLLTLSSLVLYLLQNEFYRSYLYSLFLGLVLGSVFFCYKLLREVNWKSGVLCLVGAAFAYFLTNLPEDPRQHGPLYSVPIHLETPSAKPLRNFDVTTSRLTDIHREELVAMLAKGIVTKETLVYDQANQRLGAAREFVKETKSKVFNTWVILCGIIGISAMLLPGISGSYLLNILGLYPAIIAALSDLSQGLRQVSLDLDACLLLGNLLIGILLGAALFSRVLTYLLDHYHSQTISLLIGFMLGALRTVWPFWTYAYFLDPLQINKGSKLLLLEPTLPLLNWRLLVALVLVGVGFIVVNVLEKLALVEDAEKRKPSRWRR